ncbi:Phospholipase A2 domain-containing protein [Strongyloides ratti]|uniref:Phospholipase A2 domain-containing protein n=1 Tax=Strongyloides ratti TaxID=34506 RepID=A0A090LLA7_STRRB|nr:Phospholipase A2 domain-containing protein [Strongyloides ratti]CEF68958.1 Phospholipase A2 domain-containing protein [Strongyloides ratti]
MIIWNSIICIYIALCLLEGKVTFERYKKNNTEEINTGDEVMPETINYMCGTGVISAWISKTIAKPCGTSMLNNCCLDHDVCYDDLSTDQKKCDDNFCDCIWKSYSNSKYCARWLSLTHCTTVKVLGYFPLIAARKINTREQFIEGISDFKTTGKTYLSESGNINFTKREYLVKLDEP